MLYLYLVVWLVATIQGSQGTNLRAKDRCAMLEFKCLNGKCIPETFRCNKRDECGDGSDEKLCIEDTFMCDNGDIIKKNQLCDGIKDCDNDEDYSKCKSYKCNVNEWLCETRSSKIQNDLMCIGVQSLCNSQKDCKDGSDETPEACEILEKSKIVKCDPTLFQCHDKTMCISQRFVCDNHRDCSDNSDESNCKVTKEVTIKPEVITKHCSSDEFYCGADSPSGCITKSWYCDQSLDCEVTGLDEKQCPNFKCPVHRPIKCKSEDSCFTKSMICDGHLDCSDGTDEHDCDSMIGSKFGKAVSCNKYTEWTCLKKNQCIPLSKVCDNFDDCGDSSDERPGGDYLNCQKKLCDKNNGGCQAKCANYFFERRCYCPIGFKHPPNNKTRCVDIDECAINNGGCSQICKNTNGSYQCSCYDGFLKSPTNTSICLATGEKFLLFAADNSIRELRIVHHQLKDLIINASESLRPIGIDYDYINHRIFWTQLYPIPKINIIELSGANKNQLLVDQSKKIIRTLVDNDQSMIKMPVGIAYDWIHGLLFYTDNELKQLVVVNVTNHARKVLIQFTRRTQLRNLVVHPEYRKIYFCDWGKEPKIESVGYDGLNRKELISVGLETPNGLAIDYYQYELYIADARKRSIIKYNLKTTQIDYVVTHLNSHIFSLDIFENWLYAADWSNNKIWKINKITGSQQVLVYSPKPMGLKLMHQLAQPMNDVENACSNHNCQYLCLPIPLQITNFGKKYRCVCPESSEFIAENNTCTEPKEFQIYRTSGMTPYQIKSSKLSKLQNAHKSTVSKVVGPVLTFVLLLLIACIVVGVVIYRNYNRKVIKNAANFPNPTYFHRTPTAEIEIVNMTHPVFRPLHSQLSFSSSTHYEPINHMSNPLIETDNGTGHLQLKDEGLNMSLGHHE